MERSAQTGAQPFLALLLNRKDPLETAKRHSQNALSQRANPPAVRPAGQPGRSKPSPARTLLDRLKMHQDKLMAFVYDWVVPFDNKLAEPHSRRLKGPQKGPASCRSAQAAHLFCQLRSYLSTAR